jgi:hypothetical protein
MVRAKIFELIDFRDHAGVDYRTSRLNRFFEISAFFVVQSKFVNSFLSGIARLLP